MKNKLGFTLIEMLVVVLIIGILAGVALPQYTNAVRKARVAEAKITLKAWVDATDRHYLNSTNNPSLDDIDIEFSDSKNWHFYEDECMCNNNICGCAMIAEPKWENDYYIYYASNNYNTGEGEYLGKMICTTWNDRGRKICKSLGGKQIYENDDDYYEI